MADKKDGIVVYRRALSPVLEIFRIAPADGSKFPRYQAGQYMALSRDNCRLTKKIGGEGGERQYAYDRDEAGNIRRGNVTHSYSIASAPHETEQEGYIEFYVGLEVVVLELPGRLTESLFQVDPESDNRLQYVDKISGSFTVDARGADARNIVLVATGTGLAPFISMLKQLHHDAARGVRDKRRYTLIHSNRTLPELGYHEELLAIERAQKIDFAYVPSVSRPSAADLQNPDLGKGRANNILRLTMGMKMKEERSPVRNINTEELGRDTAAQNGSGTLPVLPRRHSGESLRERIGGGQSVIMTCGNPLAMDDIRYIAAENGIRFEMEEW